MSSVLQGPDYSSKNCPNIMIIADGEMRARSAQDAVAASGYRIAAQCDLDGALGSIADQTNLDAVIIECEEVDPEQVYPVVDSLRATTRPKFLISAPIEHLDHYSAFLTDDDATLMCAPDVPDRVLALQLACRERVAGVRESNNDYESMRLRRIADEVARIAKALSNISEPELVERPIIGVSDVMTQFRGDPDIDFQTAKAPVAGPSAQDIRMSIRLRRMREQHFAADLFADPAWDMLLDLLAARLEHARVAVSSLCIAAAVPPTTALRWIKRMSDDGLLERAADPDDGRRIFIQLSDAATEAMTRYWTAAQRVAGMIV